jgi:hypothetical protein
MISKKEEIKYLSSSAKRRLRRRCHIKVAKEKDTKVNVTREKKNTRVLELCVKCGKRDYIYCLSQCVSCICKRKRLKDKHNKCQILECDNDIIDVEMLRKIMS